MVAGVSELLAHELVLPVGCLVLAAIFGHEAWDYERHGCWYIIPFSFGLVLGGGSLVYNIEVGSSYYVWELGIAVLLKYPSVSWCRYGERHELGDVTACEYSP